MDPWWRLRVGDALAIVVCLAAGLLAVSGDVLPGGIDAGEAAGLVVGVLAFGAVPWRRRWPVLFTVATSLLGLWTPIVGYLSLVGLFTVAVQRRWPVTAGVALTLVGVTALDLRSAVGPAEYPTFVAASSAVVVTVAATGLVVGARRQLLASLRERAERAEADQALRAEQARTAERRRIAREMHDVLGHRLSLLSVHAGALELRADLPAETVHRTAGVLRETARAAMDDLREIVLVLREPAAADDGPAPRLADVPELVAQSRTAGVEVEVRLEVVGVPPEHLGRTAYRVVQEGLTNARRHARGTPVSVEVTGNPAAVLAVRVESGPAGAAVEQGAGTGLIGLGERVALAGGELEHGTGADGRHVLTARIPWSA